MLIPFATQAYEHDSLPISAQRVINAYPESEPPDAKTPVAVLMSPGIGDFVNLGQGPIRGFVNLKNVLYAVAGQNLFRVNANKTTLNVGGAVTGTSLVSMASNGEQIGIVNGVNGYTYSVADGFDLITDVNFHSANTIEFFDQMFLLDWIGTDRFFGSDLLDGQVYPQNFFGSAEWKPDDMVAVKSDKMRVVLFGKESIELWQNSGAANFPFVRIEGAGITRGVVGSQAITYEDNTLFFLGEDLIFYRLQGASPVRVSNHAVEQAWRKYIRTDDVQCLAFTFEGHKFIVVTFPSVPHTWVLDLATNKWHERESFDQNNNSLGRWRINCAINIYGQYLVGDAFSGRIGLLSRDLFTEWGNPMKAQFVAPPIHGQGRKLFQRSLWIDMETGTGSISEPTIDPTEKVLLQLDGGDGSTDIIDTNSGGDIHVWTASGTAQIDTSESVFGGSSLLLSGAGFVSTPAHTDFDLGTSDVTIAVWFNCNAPGGTSRAIAGQSDNAFGVGSSWALRREASGVLRFIMAGGVNLVGTTQFTNIVNPGWHYVEVVRSGPNFFLFVDGVLEATGTSLSPFVSSVFNLFVGERAPAADPWIGWIDAFALYVGVARHTSDYIVPPLPPGLPTERAPQAFLDWSDNGGRSYSTLQLPRSTGKLGEYTTRVRWLQLGSFYNRTYRLTLPDPVRRTLIAAYGDGNGAPFEIEK